MDPHFKYLDEASLGRQIRFYKRYMLAKKSTSLSIWFLKSCKQQSVFPKWINIKSRSNSFLVQKSVYLCKLRILNGEINAAYTKRNTLNSKIYFLYQSISSKLPWHKFNDLISNVRDIVSLKGNQQFSRLKHRLYLLTQLGNNMPSKHNYPDFSKSIPHEFYNRTIDLTGNTFTDLELSLLDKGLKYSPRVVAKVSEVKLALAKIERALKSTNLPTVLENKLINAFNINKLSNKLNNKN